MPSENGILRLSWLLILLGIGLQSWHYFEYQSLWLDETYVAAEITLKSFKDIFSMFGVFGSQPRTPVFFQAVVKAASGVIPGEAGLRLFPFLCTIGAVPLFYFFCKKITDPLTTLLSLALFIFNPVLIYYAAELKPYAVDVFFCLGIGYLFLFYDSKKFERSQARELGGIMALSLCFSFASALMSGAVMILMGYRLWKEKRLDLLLALGVPFAAFFLIIYAGTINPMVTSTYVMNAWDQGFMPLGQGVIATVIWLGRSVINLFQDPLQLASPWMGCLLAVVGARALFKRDPRGAGIALLPFVVLYFASAIRLYPVVRGRILLFLLPLLCLLAAAGAVSLASRFPRIKFALLAVLAAMLLIGPVNKSFQFLSSKDKKTAHRAAMTFLKAGFKKGDKLFYNNSSQFAMFYYANQMGILKGVLTDPNELIVGRTNDLIIHPVYVGFTYEAVHVQDLKFTGRVAPLNNKTVYPLYIGMQEESYLPKGRVWIYLSQLKPGLVERITGSFDSLGKRVKSFEAHDVRVYLYEL